MGAPVPQCLPRPASLSPQSARIDEQPLERALALPVVVVASAAAAAAAALTTTRRGATTTETTTATMSWASGGRLRFWSEGVKNRPKMMGQSRGACPPAVVVVVAAAAAAAAAAASAPATRQRGNPQEVSRHYRPLEVGRALRPRGPQKSALDERQIPGKLSDDLRVAPSSSPPPQPPPGRRRRRRRRRGRRGRRRRVRPLEVALASGPRASKTDPG